MDVLNRFRSKVEVMESGCHEWRSTLHRDGYGKFYFNGDQTQAHRVAWIIYVGEIPENGWILHKCDNRKCVNPDHLYVGDAKQNARDMHDRARARGNTRLSFEAIKEIRNRYSSERISQQRLADEYGCDQTHVSKIVRSVQRLSR